MVRIGLMLGGALRAAARLLAAPWAVLLLLLLAVGGAIETSVLFPPPPPPPPPPPAKATPVPEAPKPEPPRLAPVPAPLALTPPAETPAPETPASFSGPVAAAAPVAVPVPAPSPSPASPPKAVPAAPPANPAASVTVEVKPDGSIVEGPLATNEELYKEVKHLQQKFDDLQEVLNLMVTQMMSDVEHENAQLRAEVKRLQARDQAGLLATQAIPKPGVEVLEQLAEQVRDDPPDPDAPEEPQTPLPPAAFSFRVLKEWGRDAEAVKQLGGKAPTLKGVVGVVPLGAAREDVENLGRELRAKYAEFDNINVEIFDDPVAAQSYVDTQTMQPEHRVLSVSKYAATNRDAITYFEGGASSDVANTPPAGAEQAPEDAGTAPAPDASGADAPQEEGPHLTQTTIKPPEPTEEEKAAMKKQQSKHSPAKKRRPGK